MIKAESLSRKYGDVRAVDNVSFQIEHGEIVGLLGHNGAGKTTIMKMLTGYLEPTDGKVTINDLDIINNRVEVERTIGYLPENCPVYPEMIVLDYLDYAASLRGVLPERRVERIRYALEKTRLREVAQKPINTLSRGYRQRLGVAQAILNSPKILILDEPTNGLDPSQIQEMRSLIKELAENATVLISTHILQEVQAICGRVIIIDRGKLALDAAMAELRKTDRLLVTTSAPPDKVEPVIREIKHVQAVSSREADGQHLYTVEFAGNKLHEVAPAVASALVKNDLPLYSLQPQIRDLETIFKEITTASANNGGAAANNGGSGSVTADSGNGAVAADSGSGAVAANSGNGAVGESGGNGAAGEDSKKTEMIEEEAQNDE